MIHPQPSHGRLFLFLKTPDTNQEIPHRLCFDPIQGSIEDLKPKKLTDFYNSQTAQQE